MRKYMLIGISLLLLCGTSLNAMADDFDGSRELMCACARIIECTPDGNCREVQAEDVGVPEFLRINFEKKTIAAPLWGEAATPSRIENLERIDGKLILQGAEDGLRDVKDGAGWSIAISEDTGKMVLTLSGDYVGFVIFGACTPF